MSTFPMPPFVSRRWLVLRGKDQLIAERLKSLQWLPDGTASAIKKQVTQLAR